MATGLKSLTLTVLPASKVDASTVRREKIVARLEEQKRLLADPAYVRTTKRSVNKDGVRTVVDHQRKVSPWWRFDPAGACVFSVRLGSQRIEFEKGKAGIAVGKLDALPGVIDTLIAAVRGGDLDGALAQSAKRIGPAVKKKAA